MCYNPAKMMCGGAQQEKRGPKLEYIIKAENLGKLHEELNKKKLYESRAGIELTFVPDFKTDKKGYMDLIQRLRETSLWIDAVTTGAAENSRNKAVLEHHGCERELGLVYQINYDGKLLPEDDGITIYYDWNGCGRDSSKRLHGKKGIIDVPRIGTFVCTTYVLHKRDKEHKLSLVFKRLDDNRFMCTSLQTFDLETRAILKKYGRFR